MRLRLPEHRRHELLDLPQRHGELGDGNRGLTLIPHAIAQPSPRLHALPRGDPRGLGGHRGVLPHHLESTPRSEVEGRGGEHLGTDRDAPVDPFSVQDRDRGLLHERGEEPLELGHLRVQRSRVRGRVDRVVVFWNLFMRGGVASRDGFAPCALRGRRGSIPGHRRRLDRDEPRVSGDLSRAPRSE